MLAPQLKAGSPGDALTTVGYLASHYCDTPALVGIAVRDNAFVAKAVAAGTSASKTESKPAAPRGKSITATGIGCRRNR